MQARTAPRVLRGWLAALVCTWTAFGAHAHAVPTALSLVAMVLVTAVSAVVAMALLGRKFALWATSLVVLASQFFYHLAWAGLGHGGGHLSAVDGLEHAAHYRTHASGFAQAVTGHYAGTGSHSMLWAHIAAAAASIVVLHYGEKLMMLLGRRLSLSAARGILARASRRPVRVRPVAAAGSTLPLAGRLFERLPLLRGPPALPAFN